MTLKISAALLGAALLSTGAQAVDVTPGNLQGWASANVAGSATVGITSTYTPPGAGQNGSLQFTSPSTSGKADYVYSLAGMNVLLSDIASSAISFDYYRSSTSTVAAHFIPALRFSFTNASGLSGYLIWEAVYNGESVATNSWQTVTLTGDNFYQRTANYFLGFPTGATTDAQVYNKTLNDYLNGDIFTGSGGKKTYALGADTKINSIEIGIGSGWTGTFNGAVDNVSISLGNKGQVNANFQTAATTAVPEPATWAMMLIGFGAVGAAMRRRQRVNVRFA